MWLVLRGRGKDVSFLNPATSLVIPNGAVSGPRIVLGTVIPPELAAWATSKNLIFTACELFYWNDTDYGWKAVGKTTTFFTSPVVYSGTYDTGNGVYLIEQTSDNGANDIRYAIGAPGFNSFPLRFSVDNAKSFIKDPSTSGGTNEFTNKADVIISNDINADNGGGSVETWRNLTPSGSWTNLGGSFVPLRVKRVVGVPKGVWLQGAVQPGTSTANGTVIGNVNSAGGAYSPTFVQRFTAYAFGATLNIATETPSVEIATNGDIIIRGDVNTGNLFINTIYALD